MRKKVDAIWKTTQQFEWENLQQYYSIADLNELVAKIKQQLTVEDMNLLEAIQSQVPSLIKQDTIILVRTTMAELATQLNKRHTQTSYNELVALLEKLRTKPLQIIDKKTGRIIQTNWFLQLTYWENGQIELLLPNLWFDVFSQAQTDSHVLFFDFAKLKGKYALALYKCFKQEETDCLQGTPEEFREWLNAPEIYTYAQFKQNVLNKAVDEINRKIDSMNLNIVQQKRGRYISQIAIHNHCLKKE